VPGTVTASAGERNASVLADEKKYQSTVLRCAGTGQGGIMVTRLHNGGIEFRFYRPAARDVTVVGDFNGWHQTSLPMTRTPDGWWRCQVRIAPGCYHFRYLSDGEWFMDYAAFGLDYGPHGLSSVVSVESPPTAAVRTSSRAGAARRSNRRDSQVWRNPATHKPTVGPVRRLGKDGTLSAAV